MSEYVQALELRISDNAQAAATGLDKLAASLRKIKSTIGQGLKLDKVADQLKSFNNEISSVASPDNVARLGNLASALERIVNATKGMGSVRGLKNAVREVNGQGATAKEGGFKTAVQQTQEIADNINKAASAMNNVRRLAGSAFSARRIAEESWHDARVLSREESAALRGRAVLIGGGNELSTQAARHVEDITDRIGTTSVPRLTDGVAEATNRARSFADEFKRAESAASNVHRLANSTFRANGSTHGVNRHNAYNWMDPTAVDAGRLSAGRLRYEVDKMFQEGGIGVSMWRSLHREIGTINWKDALGPSGAAISEGEAGNWISGLVESLTAESANSASGSAAARLEEFMRDVDYAVSKSGSIEELTQRIENMKAALANDVASGKVKDGSETYFKRIAAIKRLADKQDKMSSPADQAKELAMQTQRLNEARERVQGLTGMSKADLVGMKIKDQENNLANGIANGKMSDSQIADAVMRIQHLKEELRSMNQEGEKSTSWLTKLETAAISKLKTVRESFNKVRGAIFSANGGLLSFLGGMMRIAKYRLFRSLIRNITEGFSTGLQNVRQYSKAIDGLYHKDMSGLDNSLLKMKNSLGAAVAPAIQALIPLFQRLTSAVIEVSNWVNQFFALINGASTWTRAIDVNAEEIEEMGNAASGAAKKVNNLLAAWDELNIIQSQSGGGGAGGKQEDLTKYTKMFEEVDVFDSKIRDIVGFLQDNLPLVEAVIDTLLLKLAGLTLPAAAITVSAVLSYGKGNKAGLLGKSWGEALAEDMPTLLGLGAAGGGLLGLKYGLSIGHPVQGMIIGLVAGAAVSLFANEIGWIIGDNEVNGANSFGSNLEENMVNIVGSILGGAGLGVLIGTAIGHPVAGALVGFTVGAAVGIGASLLEWKDASSAEVEIQEGFVDKLTDNVAGILGAVVAGASFGAYVGGGYGALIGAVIGLVASISLTAVEYNAKQERLRQLLQWGKISLTANEIKEWVADIFKFDVDAFVSVRNARVDKLMSSRLKIKQAVDNLTGQYTAYVKLGITEATPEEISSLRTQVDTVVTELNGHLDDIKVMVGLMLTEGITYVDANKELFEGSLADIEGLQKYITGLGAEIGKILSDGVVDEFEKDTLEGLMQSLTDVTRAVTEGRNVGSRVANVKAAAEKFQAGDYTQETIEEFSKTYSDEVGKINEAALKEAKEYQSDLYGIAYGMEASGKFTESEVKEAFLRAEQFPVQRYADELASKYVEPTREIYREAMEEAVRGAASKWTPQDDNQIVSLIGKYYTQRSKINPNDSTTGRFEYFLQTPGEMGNLLGYFANQTTGISWDSIQTYYDAGGNLANLLPDDILMAIAAAFGIENIENFGHRRFFGDSIDRFRDVVNTPKPEDMTTWEYVQELMKEDPFAGKNPNGTVSGAAGVYGSGGGGAPETYIANNNGIVYTGSSASVENEADERDAAAMEEQNRLLREQNSLLTRIANKELRIYPTANLGNLFNRAVQMANATNG